MIKDKWVLLTESEIEKIQNSQTMISVMDGVYGFKLIDLKNVMENITFHDDNTRCIISNGRKDWIEIFYIEDYHQYNFIVDNYPGHRKIFKTSFPIDTVEEFLNYLYKLEKYSF